MSIVRTTALRLTYDGVDISADIAPYVLSFEYTDNEGGKADDLRVTLEDRAGLWRGGWYPQKGAMLRATIISTVNDIQRTLPCGTFAIDELNPSGPPSVVSIKAVSSLTAKGFKREKKTRGWEKTNLQAIAVQMANDHGMKLYFNVGSPPRYGRVDQRQESDLAFLKRLCDEADLNLKVADEKLIIYESKAIDAMPAVATISLGPQIKSYRFRDKTEEIYRACEVAYWDPDAKAEKTYTYRPPELPPVGQVLKINQRVESYAAAMTLAERSLRKKNKLEQTGDFRMPGDTAFLAGVNIIAAGFGAFDGKHFITEARHSYSRGGGYETEIRFRRVMAY